MSGPGSTIEGLLSARWSRRFPGRPRCACRHRPPAHVRGPRCEGGGVLGGSARRAARAARRSRKLRSPPRMHDLLHIVKALLPTAGQTAFTFAQVSNPTATERAPHGAPQGRHGHRYNVRIMSMNWVELRRFELLTSCMPYRSHPSLDRARHRPICRLPATTLAGCG
jgi:hypothetical protein